MTATTWRHAIVLFLACAACAADDSGASSGVEGSKSLQSLDADEAQKICDLSLAAVRELLGDEELICTGLALNDAATAEACIESRDACLRSEDHAADHEEEELEDFECQAEEQFAGCTARVSEFEACIGDSLAALRKARDEVTCDKAGDTDSLQELGEDPVSCQSLYAKCPELD